MTEKYLDFSFEKTNSAYMLFYEWRSGKGGNEQRNQSESPTSLSPGSSISQLQETGIVKSDEAHASTSSLKVIAEDVKQLETVTPLRETAVNCDLDIMAASTSSRFLSRKSDDEIKSLVSKKSKRKSLLNKDLEEWIWQDNRHYLEDRNIFEHTYFK